MTIAEDMPYFPQFSEFVRTSTDVSLQRRILRVRTLSAANPDST
jgi:hypothetical protein